MLDRIGSVVKAEWTHLRRRRPRSDDGATDTTPPTSTTTATTGAPKRSTAVHDVEGALRVLELSGTPSLAEVRARYHALTRRYWPKTQSDKGDEAYAARVVVDALTDALELLEEHLLPLA